MKIRLLAFATAADALGARETELTLEAGATVGALRAELVRRFPPLAALAPALAVAVGGAIAPASHSLADGDEVALLPPVSGG